MLPVRGGGWAHWSDQEIDETAFKDAWLCRRFGDHLRQLGDAMGNSIPFACRLGDHEGRLSVLLEHQVGEGDILKRRRKQAQLLRNRTRTLIVRARCPVVPTALAIVRRNVGSDHHND